ncbi:MAG: phosphotransferase family protein [Candidatus Dormibacteria bacterium]
MDEEMLANLRAFFAEEMPKGESAVTNLVNTSLGRSRENWSFDLAWQENGVKRWEPLMLRRDPLGGLVETDRVREFRILRALEDVSVPAPAVRWLDADGKWFERPSLIMRREPGVCDYFVVSGTRPLSERVGLAERFCDLLALVHTVDWRSSELARIFDDPGAGAALAELDQWEAVLRADQREAYPEIELAIQWLRTSPPEATTTVLVHGDYKPGNILLEGTRVGALLDWELAHLGDPMEDLGWVTQPLRRREHLIPGAWEESQLFERYQERSGITVDPEHVRWWNMFATFRTAVMQVSGLRSFMEGRATESYRPTSKVLRALVEAASA